MTAKAKAAKAINLIIRFPPMSSDFPEAWIVVALAQQSLIQIKIDLAGAETAGIAADPIFGEVWLRGVDRPTPHRLLHSSLMGRKRTWRQARRMSALPPIADIQQRGVLMQRPRVYA
ncbi:MAG: hypothetical protein WAM76_02515, partial [Pseudolabrys sp.]